MDPRGIAAVGTTLVESEFFPSTLRRGCGSQPSTSIGMEIADVHRRFAAYASGGVTEIELRNVIRSALLEQPSQSEAYIALTEAYRYANVIDEDLQSDIVADITELTGPRHEPSEVPPPARSTTDTLFADASFAGRTDYRG